jgi:NAD(P)-dependent dehydrogenase (short-subunit alcohol dehydrogenase family)
MNAALNSFPRGATALIQGASRGIGLGLVRALLASDRIGRVVATCRNPDAAESLAAIADQRLDVRSLDVTDADAVGALAASLKEQGTSLSLLINAAGVLHGDGFGPEKRLEDLDPAVLQRVFAVNAFGPALMLRHFHPLMARDGKAVFAAISARVGSIADNRIGGWYAYRASKAALNQLLRTASIEFARRHKNAIVVALHPGTTDTGLSRPFQANVPEEQLFSVDKTVGHMLSVIDGLSTDDSGGFFAWDGQPIEW